MFIQAKSPKITGVLSFTALYLLGFIAYALLVREFPQLIYVGIQIALTCIVYIAHRHVNYSLSLLWCLSIWGFLHLTGEHIYLDTHGTLINSLSLFGKIGNFNRLVHVYGFAIATWVSWQTLCHIIHHRYQRRLMPTTGLLLLCVTSSMGYSALNEMVKFASTMSNVNSDLDNYHTIGWDMIAASLGALIAALVIKVRSL